MCNTCAENERRLMLEEFATTELHALNLALQTELDAIRAELTAVEDERDALRDELYRVTGWERI